MQVSKARHRGFVLTATGWARLEVRIREHEGRSGRKGTAREIAREAQIAGLPGVHHNTVKKLLDRTVGVDQSSIALVFALFGLDLEAQDCAHPQALLAGSDRGARECTGAVDASLFYGRSAELATLRRWLAEERCRLVTVFGIGGMGKTMLAARLLNELADRFECVLWRTLSSAPPVALLADLNERLGGAPGTGEPLHPERELDRFIEHLQERSCLVVLDGLEAVLERGTPAGTYCQGYEAYGALFKAVALVAHRSCLLITTREKPWEVGVFEGATMPVRSLKLQGMTAAEGRQLFEARGRFSGSDADWQTLVGHYAGNPLALKIVASNIEELFAGDIGTVAALHRQGQPAFSDVRELISGPFERLSALEREVIYELALACTPVSPVQLQENLYPSTVCSALFEAVQSLGRRALIEGEGGFFWVQSVVAEEVSGRLIEELALEIAAGAPVLLATHALVKAGVSEYARESQTRLVVALVARLRLELPAWAIEARLRGMLNSLHAAPSAPGYLAGNLFNLLVHLGAEVSDFDFSNLTLWHADLTTGRRLNVARADLTRARLIEDFGQVRSIAFCADSGLLATGDANGMIRLRRTSDGLTARTLSGGGCVWALAFSGDGRQLASAAEGRLTLWDRHGVALGRLEAGSERFYSLAFSPGGGLLAAGGDDGTVRVWEVASGRRFKLAGHSGRVTAVAFDSDGQLASASEDGTVRLWSLERAECLYTLGAHRGKVWSVAFSQDGVLATGSEDRTVKLWAVRNGECLGTLGLHSAGVWSVVFRPGGEVVSGTWDGTVRVWAQGRCLSLWKEQANLVYPLVLSADGRQVALGDSDRVYLREVDSGRLLRTWQGYDRTICSIASAGDRRLVNAGQDRAVQLWEEGCFIRSLRGHSQRVLSVSCAAAGRTLASASADGSVRLWDALDGRCLQVLTGHSGRVNCAAFSPDGLQLASSSADSTVRLWDPQSGRCLNTLAGHADWVLCVAFSPDGQWLASSSDDRTVKLWQPGSGQLLRTLAGHGERVSQVAFHPQGGLLASASHDRTVKLWQAATGLYLKSLVGHTDWVWSVAFSPDGRLLASASHDRTVRLWQVSSGECLAILHHCDTRTYTVTFSPDGCTLISGGDATLRYWDVQTHRCLCTLQTPGPYQGMNITGTVGLSEEQKSNLKSLGAFEESV